jgi:hypothetical protein
MGCLLVTALYNFFYRSAADHPINWESGKSRSPIRRLAGDLALIVDPKIDQ